MDPASRASVKLTNGRIRNARRLDRIPRVSKGLFACAFSLLRCAERFGFT